MLGAGVVTHRPYVANTWPTRPAAPPVKPSTLG